MDELIDEDEPNDCTWSGSEIAESGTFLEGPVRPAEGWGCRHPRAIRASHTNHGARLYTPMASRRAGGTREIAPLEEMPGLSSEESDLRSRMT
jgi:hypothetical protein